MSILETLAKRASPYYSPVIEQGILFMAYSGAYSEQKKNKHVRSMSAAIVSGSVWFGFVATQKLVERYVSQSKFATVAAGLVGSLLSFSIVLRSVFPELIGDDETKQDEIYREAFGTVFTSLGFYCGINLVCPLLVNKIGLSRLRDCR